MTVPAALCVYFPDWSIDLLHRRERRADAARGASGPARTVLLVQTVGQLRTVAACCDLGARAGVRTGMTLAHARALLPPGCAEPRIEPFDPAGDAAALEALARWCTRLAPVVAPDPPDGLLMDLSGCERVYKGRRNIVQQVSRAMVRLGLRARIALAPTFGCAWAMARFGGSGSGGGTGLGLAGLLVVDGRQREAMAPLPVESLRLDAGTVRSLREVAIDRVGDLMRLPRASLAPRFGGVLLLRIDQAMGDAMEVLSPVRPPEPVQAEILFDGPTTQAEAIECAGRELLVDLCGQLASSGRGTRCAVLSLLRSDLPPLVIELATSRPTSSAQHLWRLLHPKLQRAQLGFGVEGLRLQAVRLARVRDRQQSWLTGNERADPGEQPAAEMIDALAARLGEQRVLCPRVAESHIPERVGCLVSAMRRPSASDGRAAPAITAAPRPTILLSRPEPAEVIALWPEGPPSWVRWRGREMKIVHAAGPERVCPEWWRGDEVSAATHRDYFRVVDECGAAVWVFRDHAAARWFVHGLW